MARPKTLKDEAELTPPPPRVADHPIDPRFLARWSPRAFDGTAIDHNTLMCLFEAARWAPSSFNVQPWRFVYARRDTADWERLLGALIPFNRSWAVNAGALVYVLSDTLADLPKGGAAPSHSHSFDAGASWAFLALQAGELGLYTHGMSGVDFDAARTVLAVPRRFRIEAAVAVGRLGRTADLPEGLRAREHPSLRRAVAEIAFEGRFSIE